MEIFTTWENLKAFIAIKNLDMFYKDNPSNYVIYTLFEHTQFGVELWKDESCQGIDMEVNNVALADFETNYKNGAMEL